MQIRLKIKKSFHFGFWAPLTPYISETTRNRSNLFERHTQENIITNLKKNQNCWHWPHFDSLIPWKRHKKYVCIPNKEHFNKEH